MKADAEEKLAVIEKEAAEKAAAKETEYKEAIEAVEAVFEAEK
jgi:hypothetical protein